MLCQACLSLPALQKLIFVVTSWVDVLIEFAKPAPQRKPSLGVEPETGPQPRRVWQDLIINEAVAVDYLPHQKSD